MFGLRKKKQPYADVPEESLERFYELQRSGFKTVRRTPLMPVPNPPRSRRKVLKLLKDARILEPGTDLLVDDIAMNGAQHFYHVQVRGRLIVGWVNGQLVDNPDRFETSRPPIPFVRPAPKVGRNEPCPCGSGRKFKKCCGK